MVAFRLVEGVNRLEINVQGRQGPFVLDGEANVDDDVLIQALDAHPAVERATAKATATADDSRKGGK